MRLILVRHAETDWNHEFRVQGQADLPLSELGKKQTELIAMRLKDVSVDAIISSPLRRALETAKAINRFHDVGIETSDGLKELDTGEIDGLHLTEIGSVHPDFYRVWVNDAASARIPGGESLTELQERVWGSIQSILKRTHLGTVVVVSHFFALITLLCKVMDISLSDMRRLSMAVGSISILDVLGERIRLTVFGDACHLEV